MPRRRRRRPNRPLRTVIAACAAAALLYALVVAWWQSGPNYSFAVVFGARLIDILVAAWLFWVGSSIGSFLNVVAWRMPRGRSLGGRSRCPYCSTQLQGRDNIPVFGWLALRGRCRTCRLPISPRYPIVELVCGILFLLFAFPELWRGGANLPWADLRAVPPSPLAMPWITPLLIALVVYHAVALTNLMAFGLIRIDRAAVPNAWIGWSCTAAALPLFLLPQLRVIPWQMSAAGPPRDGLLGSLAHILCGLAVAGLMGRLLGRTLCPDADLKLRPLAPQTRRLLDLIAALAIMGIVLGWQPLLAVLPMALLTGLAVRRFWNPGDPLGLVLICLAPTAGLYIAFWDFFESQRWLPGAARSLWPALGAAVVSWLLMPFFRLPAQPREQVAPVASDQADSQEEPSGEAAGDAAAARPEGASEEAGGASSDAAVDED